MASEAPAQKSLSSRSYFYIGGEYTNTSAGQIFQNQMYVERLTPPHGPTKPYPIIFIHGGAQSGTNWLNKPDGGKGWASCFLDHGYEVYIVDNVATGRSPWYPNSNVTQTAYGAEFIAQRFTATQNLPLLWPQAHLHTQWPGTGEMGDAIFDAYFASTVQFPSNRSWAEERMRDAGAKLLDRVGAAVLITHSTGGLYGWHWADVRPGKVKALVQIEPRGPPFREAVFSSEFSMPWGLTSTPLTYSPASSTPLAYKIVAATGEDKLGCVLQEEPARQLVNLRDLPILIETGEASYHAMYDYCFKLFLEQAGCRRVEHLELKDIGIRGNGHLQFLERNSDKIAAVLEGWIAGVIGMND